MDTRPRRDNRYYRRNKQESMSGKVFLVAVVLVLALLAFFCYLMWGNVTSEITLEAGAPLEATDFLVLDWGMKAKFSSDISQIDPADTGDYIVKVRYHGTDFYSKLHIVDTMAPVVTHQDVVVYSTELPKPDIFIQQVQDGTAVTVTYVQTPDMSIEGDQEVQLCVTDRGGNAVFTTAKMTVIPDYEGPKILGVNKFSLYAGGTISYRNGVIVEDNCDDAPVLTIDSSRVDLSTPGEYEVIYRATDAAGNTTTLTAPVKVGEKPDSYVEEAEIIKMADELLATFITPDMTTRQQVEAIYDWVDDHCSYLNRTDKTDRMQGAYVMMSTRSGDCFNYFAISSLFFERLGIPQINVERSPKSVRTTKHYWSLVSVDGGETYYHFDVCPLVDYNWRICLSTDAELESCNKYLAGYYTYEKDLYPATPEE